MILVADRKNERLQWFDLDGSHLETLRPPEDKAYRRPCHFDQRGSELLLPGLDGWYILDKDNQQIAILGNNNNPQQRSKNNVPPEHEDGGVCFAARLHVGPCGQHLHYRVADRRPGNQAAKG